MRRVLPILCLVALAASVFLVRAARFGDLEPRIDQAHCSRWLQDVRRADHVWPRAEAQQGFRAALEEDRGSALHHLVRRLFNQGIRVFNLVSFATLWLASFLLGDSYRAHTIVSILASCGAIVLVGLCPFWCRSVRARSGSGPTDVPFGLMAAVLCATSFYLHLFSPWGWHNLGAFYALLAVVVTSRAIAASTHASSLFSVVAPLTAAGAVAIHAHYTVLFFLPPATTAALLLAAGLPWRARLRRAACYVLAMGLVILPGVFVTLGLSSEHAAAYAISPDSGAYPMGALVRAGGWFTSTARLFSAPGLVAALAGVIWLGCRRKVWMPVAFVACHFAVWALLPGFSGTAASPTWLRTEIYVLPILGVGAAYALATSVKRALPPLRTLASVRHELWLSRVVTAVLTVGLVTAHLLVQIPCLLDERRAAARVPEFHQAYLEGQGSLRPLVREIGRSLTEPSALMTWDYSLQDLFECLAERGEDRGATILPPLEVMRERGREKSLEVYLQRRRVRLDRRAAVFILAGLGRPREDVGHAAHEVLGPEGLGWGPSVDLSEMMHWETGCNAYGRVSLYRVSRTRGD